MEETNQNPMDERREVSSSPAATASSSSSFAIPAAILIGFAMIAGAIYFSSSKGPVVAQPTTGGEEEYADEIEPVPPINADDHVLGDPNAPIVIIEYSDFDCPFCKRFHETMKAVMDQYGPSGKVAWVYRHFPLSNIHPSAAHIAMASECVAELGGNEAFWDFADLVFGIRDINEQTDTTRLSEFAGTAGVDEAAFNECLESERTEEAVMADMTSGINAGVGGTPFSFIMIAGQQLPINGAESLEFMTSNLNSLLEQLEAAETAGTAETGE